MSDPSREQRWIVTFRLGGQLLGLPLEAVREIAPYCELSRPPVRPPLLEGILNLAGDPVPVVRLDRLLLLPEETPHAGSRLLIVASAEERMALLVDEVQEILELAEEQWMPLSGNHTFNACVTQQAQLASDTVHLVNLERLLLSREREALYQFLAIEQRRDALFQQVAP
jgi:purine-binding chemotaxis protein CheW